MRPRVTLPIFERQREVLASSARELLLGADEGNAGVSHTLRLAALHACLGHSGFRAGLVQRSLPELRENHVAGPGGLLDLVGIIRREAPRLCSVGLSSVSFSNGSTLRWFGAESDSEIQRIAGAALDVLLIDKADELRPEVYARLAASVLGPGGKGRRVIVGTNRLRSSWLVPAWLETEPTRPVIEISAADINRQPAAAPRILSLAEFIERVAPDFPWYYHTELMVGTAQRVADGEILRLAIEAPPRYYKSTVFSVYLPAYYAHRFPDRWAMIICADDTLAVKFAKDAREHYRSAGGSLRVDAQEADLWRTLRGGGLIARSLRSRILGHGYSLLSFDEPYGSYAEAQRLSVRRLVSAMRWETLDNRRDMRPDCEAAIVVTQQRLHEDDLIGDLLKREHDGRRDIHPLHILHLPAIKRARREPFPPSVIEIEDSRKEGAALCPEMQSHEEILALEARDPVVAAAVLGQDPLPDAGGGLFDRDHWQLVADTPRHARLRSEGQSLRAILGDLQDHGELPRFLRLIRAWDLGASEEGDPTASALGGLEAGERVIWLDATEDKLAATAVKARIVEQAWRDGRGVEISIPQDPGTGKITAEDIAGALRRLGFVAHITLIRDSKRARATPHAGSILPPPGQDQGRGRLLKADWNEHWRQAHHSFTGLQDGEDDHLVDASSDAYNILVPPGGSGGGYF